MTADLAPKAVPDFGYVRNVVEMAVRKEQKLWIDVSGYQPIAGSIRRVEKNPALGCFEQVAIRLENAATKALADHRISL